MEGRKEMFYLTTHSTHFILRLYGVGHMVKDHSDSERGNPLPPHGILFPISSKGSFICIIPQTGYHIPRSLLHQSWSTGLNENYTCIWRRPPTSFNGTLGRFLIYNAKFKGGLKQSANFFDFNNTPFYIL